MKKFITIITLLVTTSCGPVYTMQETYTPPQTEHGMFCVNSCLSQKQNCNQMCESEYNTCQHAEDIKRVTEHLVFTPPENFTREINGARILM